VNFLISIILSLFIADAKSADREEIGQATAFRTRFMDQCIDNVLHTLGDDVWSRGQFSSIPQEILEASGARRMRLIEGYCEDKADEATERQQRLRFYPDPGSRGVPK
jgi:hypothetical protein